MQTNNVVMALALLTAPAQPMAPEADAMAVLPASRPGIKVCGWGPPIVRWASAGSARNASGTASAKFLGLSDAKVASVSAGPL
jgi:hypothetical protein